ncbi:MAG: CAAX prenyl protease-related protein [Desulfobulbaceae bacterium]|nr:CAAX prenyl protease-related protein [Desulfobulbaceae bacterium]
MSPFILPFALYLVLVQISSHASSYYPLVYTVGVVMVGAATFYMVYGKGIIKIHSNIVSGIIAGIIGIVAWIFICQLQLEQAFIRFLPEWLQPEGRVAFNPFQSIAHPVGQWGFVVVRLLGLSVLVPLVEEIFWRGFLLRWVISPNWQDQKIGVFTMKSFLWVTFLFTLAHPEWLAAAVYCSLLNILLYWRRDLWNCIVAHGTSNLILGVYVISSGTWELW